MSAHNSGVPAGWREVLASLAQIVYTQNGNQHDEITSLIDSARAILAAPQAVQGPYSDADRTTLAFMGVAVSDAAPVAQAVPVAGEREAALREALEACQGVLESGCEARQGASECCEAIADLLAQPAPGSAK